MQAEKMTAELLELEALSARVEAWRVARPRTRSMPEALWDEAVVLARNVGVFRVARALRLNFDTLKRRAGSPEPAQDIRERAVRVARASPRTDFVEVKGLAEVGVVAGGHDTVVEIVACDGARLSIRWKCASADVATLIRAFRDGA
jgi:hypothetical protein